MEWTLLHGSPWAHWGPGFIGSSITAATFLAIAVVMGLGLHRGNQWRTNLLGTGTFLIFVTCGGGHLIHSIQLIAPTLGWSWLAGEAAQIHYSDWHLWVADGGTALAGTAYWLMRRRLPGVVKGAALYEDLRVREREAAFVHDGVVQALSKAKLAAEMGQTERAHAFLEDAMASGQAAADAASESRRLLEES